MSEPSTPEHSNAGPPWVARLVEAEPRVPLMGPYMVYLALMFAIDYLPKDVIWRHTAIVLHIIGAGWATLLVRNHWPPLGKFKLHYAIVVGLFAAWMWVAGQHWLESITIGGVNLGGTLSFGSSFPFVTVESLDPANIKDIAAEFPTSGDFWTHVILKITRAVTLVPIVEELFWRGFILRAFIHWDRFETVQLGQFGWFAFIGSSLLSVVQHPANWGVSIACWMLFNGLFYITKSLRCLILTHAVTNLALYIYVVRAKDWQFW
ncbi:MAG: CAAX prenyl protease-related protein [Planctomycetes bacterium]|nr:CAAX prenyl protease-related protein [Planctomycetota bacterium]